MISALVLAAGSSQRFGYGHKLLAPLQGVPLLAYTLRALADSLLRSIVVVTGPAQRRVTRLCRRELGPRTSLRLAHNPRHEQGMAGSLQTGLDALPRRCHAVLICLGDMPRIDAVLVRRLDRSWHPDLDYVRPLHRGQPGHPVLISRALFPALRHLSGDRGAQHVLAHVVPSRRRFVSAPRGCIVDVDTPQALHAIRRRNAQAK